MPTAPRLLIVDADDAHALPLTQRLAREGFAAERVATAAAMHAQLAAHRVALIVLDLAVPGVNLAGLARPARGLIALGAAAGVLDRVIALEQGADDCMSKSVHPQELVARIRAVLRSRAHQTQPAPADGTIRFDGWELKRPSRRLISPAGAPVPLSHAEFALLTAFLDAPRQVVSRAQLLARTSGAVSESASRRIDLLVSRLRRKLGAEGGALGNPAGPIRTVRGAGYRLEVDALDR